MHGSVHLAGVYLAVVNLVLLQDSHHQLLVHVGQRQRGVDADAAGLATLEVNVGRGAIQPYPYRLELPAAAQAADQTNWLKRWQSGGWGRGNGTWGDPDRPGGRRAEKLPLLGGGEGRSSAPRGRA